MDIKINSYSEKCFITMVPCRKIINGICEVLVDDSWVCTLVNIGKAASILTDRMSASLTTIALLSSASSSFIIPAKNHLEISLQ